MTSPAFQSIADVIKLQLTHQRKGQTALAAHIGLSQTALSRRMRGAIAFRVDELEKIAEFLSITVADLYAGPGKVAVG
jgi:DNA-binding Xre family transcriptional regulator